MWNSLLKASFLAILGIAAFSLTARADDGTKTEWSKYLSVSTVTAEVRKVDGDTVTLRVYFMAPSNNNNNGNRNNYSRNRGMSGRGMSGRGMSSRGRSSNPLQRIMMQSHHVRPGAMHEDHNYVVNYFPDTKVTGKLPSSSESQSSSSSTPPTPSSLSAGMIVNAALIRDKSIAAESLTDKDLKVRSIAYVSMNPNYKADASDAKGKKAKKKK